MKIAITGASNCGKTTIADNLAEKLNLPVLKEQRALLRKLSRKSENIQNIVDNFEDWIKIRKNDEIVNNNEFISDRSHIDLFALLSVHSNLLQDDYCRKFCNTCRMECQHYDYIIIPPWGIVTYNNLVDGLNLPANKKIKDPKMPNMNPWLNLIRHSTMLGIAHLWLPPEKLLLIPRDVVDIDERTTWLLEKLKYSRQN